MACWILRYSLLACMVSKFAFKTSIMWQMYWRTIDSSWR
jgi:hypothetical protein